MLPNQYDYETDYKYSIDNTIGGSMTDREKKRREILEKAMLQSENDALTPRGKEKLNQALAELAKLDAIPTSKEVEEAVEIAKLMIEIYEEKGGGYSQKEALQTLIQAVKPKEETCGIDPRDDSRTYGCPHCGRPVRKVEPKEEVGCEEIRKVIEEHKWKIAKYVMDNKTMDVGQSSVDLAKSLLTQYSIRRR